MDIATIQATFDRIAAPYVRALGLQIVACNEHQTDRRKLERGAVVERGGDGAHTKA